MKQIFWVTGLMLLGGGCTDKKPEPKQPAPAAAPARKAAPDAALSDAALLDAAQPDAARADAAVPMVGRCAGEPGDAPIMAPCATDCECQTGFCYAEAFNGGGFCSMDCNAPSIGDCAELRHPKHPQFQKYGCLQLNALKRRHDLKTTRICALRCTSVAECRGYSKRYDQCGNASAGRLTQWGGHTLAAFGTCIDSTVVEPDAP